MCAHTCHLLACISMIRLIDWTSIHSSLKCAIDYGDVHTRQSQAEVGSQAVCISMIAIATEYSAAEAFAHWMKLMVCCTLSLCAASAVLSGEGRMKETIRRILSALSSAAVIGCCDEMRGKPRIKRSALASRAMFSLVSAANSTARSSLVEQGSNASSENPPASVVLAITSLRVREGGPQPIEGRPFATECPWSSRSLSPNSIAAPTIVCRQPRRSEVTGGRRQLLGNGWLRAGGCSYSCAAGGARRAKKRRTSAKHSEPQ
mmetsp:Transcript_6992/g.17161  ORF Transcript_6992/g.17161 Transcript_6992/m.17161 type:complete len:261 (-) Transcript_6992:4-786(-)